MKKYTRLTTHIVCALALACGLRLAPAVGQDFKITLKTSLDVEREGGWGNSLIIHKAGPVDFRWTTREAGVTKGIWQIGEINLGVRTNHPPRAIYREGPAGAAPPGGRFTKFTIDFADVVTGAPPTTPKKYYVRLVPLNDANQLVGLPSVSTVITYVKQTVSISLGDVQPYGTFADVYIKATVNVRASGEVGTQAPAQGGVFQPAYVAAVGEPVYGDTYMPANRLRFSGLQPNTTYHFVVRGEDKDGRSAHVGGTFKTHHRKASVTFEELHVVDDADDTSQGDLFIGFFFNNSEQYSLFFKSTVTTGQTIPLTGYTVDMFDPPNPLPVRVVGVDNDDPGWTPVGYLLARCGTWLQGAGCGDFADAAVTLPFDVTGPDEAAGGPFTIAAHGERLKFNLKGRVAVTYVP